MKIRVSGWVGKKPMRPVEWQIVSGRGRNCKTHGHFSSYEDAVAALAALTLAALTVT